MKKATQKSHGRSSALDSKKARDDGRARSYLDQGGTTPLVRAYAIDCPKCSC
jgi:hypothetical protein